MRVSLWTESYDPIINGVSTSVKTLCGELPLCGHLPTVVAPQYPGFQDAGDMPVLRVPSLRTVFAPTHPIVLPPVGLSPRALRGVRFDIVHTQQPFGLGMHGRCTARRLGVPLVSTNHTLYNEYTHYFPLLPQSVVRSLLSRAMRQYYNTCALVVAPSRAAVRILQNLGVIVPLHVVPTGVPAASAVLPAAVEQTRANLNLSAHVPVLLFVGRLAREKNLDLLVDAFARVCRKRSVSERPVLVLAGSGPYARHCRQRVQASGLAPWVRFTGFLGRMQLAPVYAAATLFVFPSGTETQGVVLSEAQSFGLPCVAVDAGGAPEFVRRDVDALVLPPDADAFATAIDILLQNEDRRRAMAAAALASPLRPTPAAMAQQMIQVYEAARAAQQTATTRTGR